MGSCFGSSTIAICNNNIAIRNSSQADLQIYFCVEVFHWILPRKPWFAFSEIL